MATVNGTTDPTVATILGLTRRTGRIAWTVVAITVISLVFLARRTGGLGVFDAVEVALIVGAAALAFLASGHPLPARSTWVVVGLLLAAGAVPDPEPVRESLGDAPWELRTTTTIGVVLVARGRALAAVVVVAVVGVVHVATAPPIPEETVDSVLVVLRQLATVGIAIVVVLGVGRVQRAFVAYRAEERYRVASAEARTAAMRERRRQLGILRGLVNPVLRRIARGETGDRLRGEASLLGAEVRDLLRGRRLAVPPLVEAARAARSRGADVVLLDDIGDGSAVPSPRSLAAAAGLLESADAVRATVRATRGSGGEVVVTIVTVDAHGGTRVHEE